MEHYQVHQTKQEEVWASFASFLGSCTRGGKCPPRVEKEHTHNDTQIFLLHIKLRYIEERETPASCYFPFCCFCRMWEIAYNSGNSNSYLYESLFPEQTHKIFIAHGMKRMCAFKAIICS